MKEEFQLLVDEHYQNLYRFAYSLSKSQDEASDLVQQTFCVWAQKNHQLKDRSKAKTWLFTTLYREYLKHHRRNTKFPEVDLADAEFHLETENKDNARALDAKKAITLLNSMDETYRAPLILFFLQQHSYKEIAAVLEIPLGTVMSRISRGKKQLRSLMEKISQSQETIVNFKNSKVNN